MDFSHGGPSAGTLPDFYQSVVVMRHGDRADYSDQSWAATAARPWDPPLMEEGLLRAFNTGRVITNDLGAPIHRVFVSPFLRCLQTAFQVVSAVDDASAATSGPDSSAPSKIKVCVEYGLCEKLNYKAIPRDVAPRDWNWGFNITAASVEPVYEQMPQFGEVPSVIRSRFQQVFKTLADKYQSENILLITHGIGVGVIVSTVLRDTRVVEVDYCGYGILRRPIFRKDDSFIAGNFELPSLHHTSGIKFSPVD